MLLRFRGANHRSFRDEFELWLTASRFNQGSGRPTDLPSNSELDYLPVTMIFGANGSGKSNVLLAMRWMRHAVINSVHEWSGLDGVPRQPFELDPEAREETSLYEVDLVLGEDRFVYGFEVSDERVESEWLHAYPGGQARRQIWFERDADRDEPFDFPGEGLKGPKESLVPQTRPNALFLTVAAAFNQPHLAPIHEWFKKNLWWVSPGRDLPERHVFAKNMLRDENNRARMTGLLKAADLGVTGTEITPDGRCRLIHHGPAGEVPLEFDRESLGTQSWFAFIAAMLTALDAGAVLLVDELDASLHPMLVAEVLRIFRDAEANPRNAQLVAAAHDASLLGKAHPVRPLDRDEVRIAVKKKTGESELYPLTDARPRKDEPLDRYYLQGSYGGTPRIATEGLADEVARARAEACA